MVCAPSTEKNSPTTKSTKTVRMLCLNKPVGEWPQDPQTVVRQHYPTAMRLPPSTGVICRSALNKPTTRGRGLVA